MFCTWIYLTFTTSTKHMKIICQNRFIYKKANLKIIVLCKWCNISSSCPINNQTIDHVWTFQSSSKMFYWALEGGSQLRRDAQNRGCTKKKTDLLNKWPRELFLSRNQLGGYVLRLQWLQQTLDICRRQWLNVIVFDIRFLLHTLDSSTWCSAVSF